MIWAILESIPFKADAIFSFGTFFDFSVGVFADVAVVGEDEALGWDVVWGGFEIGWGLDTTGCALDTGWLISFPLTFSTDRQILNWRSEL